MPFLPEVEAYYFAFRDQRYSCLLSTRAQARRTFSDNKTQKTHGNTTFRSLYSIHKKFWVFAPFQMKIPITGSRKGMNLKYGTSIKLRLKVSVIPRFEVHGTVLCAFGSDLRGS